MSCFKAIQTRNRPKSGTSHGISERKKKGHADGIRASQAGSGKKSSLPVQSAKQTQVEPSVRMNPPGERNDNLC